MKCLQLVENFATRDIAQTTCAALQTNDPSTPPTLLSIKSPPEQEFITKWLFDQHGLLDSVWLNGDRFNGSTFVWRDGDRMSLTNWDVGFPTADPLNDCIQLSPRSTKKDKLAQEDGTWRDVPCSKRNLIVCETKPMVTVPELRDIVFNLRDNPGK
jgi:hypothetical protein